MSGLDVNSDGTKLVTVSNYLSKVCVHSISGTNLGSCQTVGTGNYGTGNGDTRYPVDAAFDSNGNKEGLILTFFTIYFVFLFFEITSLKKIFLSENHS